MPELVGTRLIDTMSKEELQKFIRDLGAYMTAASRMGSNSDVIVGTIGHDLGGILNYEERDFFCPRVEGYAERLADHE